MLTVQQAALVLDKNKRIEILNYLSPSPFPWFHINRITLNCNSLSERILNYHQPNVQRPCYIMEIIYWGIKLLGCLKLLFSHCSITQSQLQGIVPFCVILAKRSITIAIYISRMCMKSQPRILFYYFSVVDIENSGKITQI